MDHGDATLRSACASISEIPKCWTKERNRLRLVKRTQELDASSEALLSVTRKSRMTRAGLPTATQSSAIAFVTTDAAPMVVREPTSAITIAPAPIQLSEPIV